jgi:hypothetical protein
VNWNHFDWELSVQMLEIFSIPEQQGREMLIDWDCRTREVVPKQTNLVQQAWPRAKRQEIMTLVFRFIIIGVPFLYTVQPPMNDICRTSWHLPCNPLDRRACKMLQTA